MDEVVEVIKEPNINSMPKSIAIAINGIMSDIKVLNKGSDNQFQNYKYADIDSFLGLVNPLCSKHGLIINSSEEDCQLIGDTKKWLHIKYSYILSHVSGDTWQQKIFRNQFVQMTGGQSTGSSQSYNLKQFMRSLFQIPTGDKDLDSDRQDFNQTAPKQEKRKHSV